MKAESENSQLIAKLFFRLLPIQILLAAVNAVNGIVSSLFASNFIGTEAMSAIGLFSPINLLITALSLILVGGSQLLCGKYMGMNEKDGPQRVFSTDLVLTVGISVLMIIVLSLASVTDMTRILAGDAAVRRYLNQYILGRCIGMIPLMLTEQVSAFLSLENQRKRTTIASVVFIVSNIAFNYLFVGVLKMGAFGLALASAVGLWVFLVILLQYYFSGKSMLKLSAGHFSRKEILQIVKVGYPGALSRGYETVRGIIVNMLIVQYVGNLGLSAFAASDSIMQIFWAVPTGIRAVSRMLISISIGEEDRKSLVDSMKTALFKGIPFTGVFSAAIIIAAEPLTRLFYRDPLNPVYPMTVMALRILPICLMLSIISMHFRCYGQISGKQVLVHVLSALDGVVCVAGFTALLIPVMKMNAVYVANVIDGIVIAVVVFLYSWIVRKKLPKNMEDLMVIPEDFGVEEDARIDISVRSMSEVLSVSQQVIDFCHKRGVDERRSYYAGLFLEEMAGNVVDHGFNKDKKNHSVDIRVVHKNDDMILRIKDDCIPFNPEERQAIMDPKDRMKGVGIRLVYQGAKDVQYKNMLGLNVLTIRI